MSTTWTKTSLTLEAALMALGAAQAAAAEAGLAASVVVLDESGNLKVAARMDGASAFTEQVARDKAFSAVSSGMPTSIWGQVIGDNALAAVRLTSAIDRLNIMPGGFPITVEGAVVGSIGVSGGTDDQDVAIGEAALKALGIS